jgi:hypothetical protein
MPKASGHQWLTRIGFWAAGIARPASRSTSLFAPSGGSDGPNSTHRSRFRAVPRLALAALVLPIVLSGCNAPFSPGFPGGVRVTAAEQPVEMPGVLVPISNAQDIGSVVVIIGGSGTTSFNDYTNAEGVADHTSANPDAEWQLTMFFNASSAPGCQAVNPAVQKDGDPSGLEFDIVCTVY